MNTERRFLEPAEGFSGELAFYMASLRELRNRLRKTAADLTPEELTARAFPNAHQIGNLILHLGEAEAGWIWQILAGKELTEDEKKLAHTYDTTERDFAEKTTVRRNVSKKSTRSAPVRAKFYLNSPTPISTDFSATCATTARPSKSRCAGF